MARPDNTKVWRDIDHNKHEDTPSTNSSGDYINEAWGRWDNNGTPWKPTTDLNAVKKYVEDYLKTVITTPGADGDSHRKDMFDSIFNNMTTIGDDKKGGGLQKFLVNKGYSNLTVDNWAGAQTMSALKDYIDREIKGNQDTVSHENSGHPTLAYGNIPAATTLGKIAITPKTWENNKTLTPSAVGPTWNRKQIRNFSDAGNVINSTISSINDVINPYGIKFNNDKLDNLYSAVGNVGSRGGWDRARERALANRAYSITKGLDGKYFLKFNENRLNNKANNSYGYDISSLITSNQPT